MPCAGCWKKGSSAMSEKKKLEHIAIIMDGNGRWAAKRNLERSQGHFEGAQRVLDLMEDFRRFDIRFITLYAFSTENWKRSREEVDYLMELLARFLEENREKILRNRIRLLVTGRLEGLPGFCVDALKKIMEESSGDYEYTLILALNYGGRTEILDSVRKIAAGVKTGEIDPEEITEDMIAGNLYLPEIPDPDLMIRTSGEIRLSNFLLWELSYAEFYFTDVLWPDFDSTELEKAITTYNERNRRFGGRPC